MFPATSEIFLKEKKGTSEKRFVLASHPQECKIKPKIKKPETRVQNAGRNVALKDTSSERN